MDDDGLLRAVCIGLSVVAEKPLSEPYKAFREATSPKRRLTRQGSFLDDLRAEIEEQESVEAPSEKQAMLGGDTAEEADRLEAERLTELEKVKADRLEAERLAEVQRVKAEDLEAERLAEVERVEADCLEAERLTELERVEADRLEAERLAEFERVEAEHL
ncbi:unnamed protein product, partial [Chrysoparadoxa australica]